MALLLIALIIALLVAATVALGRWCVSHVGQRAFMPAAGFGLITLTCGFLALFLFAAIAFTEPSASAACGAGYW